MVETSGTRIGRFELLRQLGEGGFGTVYEALDREHGTRVALKVLLRHHYDALYGFKQEFRALADVFHPNLVRLHELAGDGATWFFTMELVEGVGFLDYVWQRTDLAVSRTLTSDASVGVKSRGSLLTLPDAERLRRSMQQLAEGLLALHAAGKLHRDVKPSNVMVCHDGRVVLLDFGLVADISGTNQRNQRSGTPGYMSPEQADGRSLDPASDWYSVGAMLHEALTGDLPSPQSRELAHLPPDLAPLGDLCRALLSPSQAERPKGIEVLDRLRLGSQQAASAPSLPTQNDAIVGREPELNGLRQAFARALTGRAQLMRVVGRSGIGKTKLVSSFLATLDAESPAPLVLAGRCYEHETVPYKALDSLIDALGSHVASLNQAELGGIAANGGSLLGQLFTVFQALPSAAPADASPTPLESQEQRSLAFLALRELVHRLARQRPLVLFIDDVHWGDADSARLLVEVVRAPCNLPLLVVMSYRDDSSGDFVDFLDEAELGIEQHRLEVAELLPPEARTLARQLLPDGSPEMIETVAADAGGSPIFIQQLAQQALREDPVSHTFDNVDAVVVDRVGRLDAQVQDLLRVVAVAGQPVPSDIAAHAAELDATMARFAGHAALATGLLSMRSSRSGLELDLAHDRVRAAVLTGIGSERRQLLHQRLATAFLHHQRPDVDALARHFAAAGDQERTREYSRKAAEKAESAFAFDRAARHWARLVSSTPDDEPARWQLLQRWGEALTNAGKASEASDVLERATLEPTAHEMSENDALALNRRSGELALRCGRFEVGTRRMELVLNRVGVNLPRSRSTAGFLALQRRLRLLARGLDFTPRRAEEVEPKRHARLDALWGASTGLAMANYVVADALGVAHLLEALDHGSHSQIVRALGYESAFEALIGGAFFRKRAARMLEAMDRLANDSGAPYDQAWARMSRGIVEWFRGDWLATFRLCSEAASTYREKCRGVAWELAICDSYRLPTLICLGDLTKVAQMVPRALSGAYERGDRFAAATLRMGQHGVLPLREDEPERAIAESTDAIAQFPTETYVLPHYQHLFAVVQAELYAGRGERAHELVSNDWANLKQSRLLSIQCLRVEIHHLKARAALAHAAQERTPSRRDQLRKVALAHAKKLAADQPLHAPAFAAATRASAYRLEGRDDLALASLREALGGFESIGMQLYAEAARDRIGALQGGDEGAKSRARASEWMTTHQVRNPAALVGMLLPGA